MAGLINTLKSLTGRIGGSATAPTPPATPSAVEPHADDRQENLEEVLLAIWAEVLGVEDIGLHDNFFELGGDSIRALQIVSLARRRRIQLSSRQIFEAPTLAAQATSACVTSVVWEDEGPVTGHAPLTPVQLWLFEQELPDPYHFNQSFMFEAKEDLAGRRLTRALDRLIEHHDALRTTFQFGPAGWAGAITEPEDGQPVTRIDLRGLGAGSRRARTSASADLQRCLDLESGPLLRVASFHLPDGERDRLLIVAHHLVIDGVSWRILLEDLLTAYDQLGSGQTIQLPPKTSSFKHWGEGLLGLADSGAVREELDFWLMQTDEAAAAIPVDFPAGSNTVARAATVSVSLDEDETRTLLQEAPGVYQAQVKVLLLTALLQAFAEWTGRGSLLVDFEGHGREDVLEGVDVSRTVGWFTSIFPILLDGAGESSPERLVRRVRERVDQVPNGGVGYGLLRYLERGPGARSLRAAPSAPVLFNYLGHIDEVLADSPRFALVNEPLGPLRSPRGRRSHLLEVVGMVREGRLELHFNYGRDCHREETLRTLARTYREALISLSVDGWAQVREAVPEDFPLAQLEHGELEAAFDEVEFE